METEYRGALTEESEADAAAPDANGLTAEERAFRALESRAELRMAFRAVMNGAALTGAEKELQEHRGLSGHHLPWDMIAPRPPLAIRTEHRVDAVSAAPADSHLQQHGIIGRVFARSATATLGVAMPMVATGEQNYPVVVTTDTASILAKDAVEADTADAGITAHVISPTRLQRSYLFRREDQAVLAGLEEALRADLSGAVSDLLDAQVLAGDGTTGAQFSGFLATAANGGLAIRADTPGRVTFQLAAGETARGIDGKYAGGLGECAVGDRRRYGPRPGEQVPESGLGLGAGLHVAHDDAHHGEREYPRRRGDVPRGHSCPHGRGRHEFSLPGMVRHVRDPRRNQRAQVGANQHHHRDAVRLRHSAGGRLPAAQVQGRLVSEIEYRFAALEVRDSGAVIEGTAMRYGSIAKIAGVFDESVEPGAFKIGDVILNRMHDRADPIARTDGGGLTLTDSAAALALRAMVPEYRADIRDLVARKILRGFSVEMRVTAEDWPSPRRRIIRAATLDAIGLVDRPAYGDATAAIAKRAKECRTETRFFPLIV